MADAPAVVTSSTVDVASEVLEQRKTSERYMQANYYDEWAEIYRNLKARVKPIMVKDKNGDMVEDKSRSNICLPDHFVMLRHGVARLTRNPPNLRLRGENPDAADKAAVLLMWQWDRSESQKAFRKIIACGKAFGWGIGKSFYDKIQVTRRFRKIIEKMTPEELAQLTEGMGTEDQQTGQAPMGDAMVAQLIAKYGPAAEIKKQITKYEGCTLNYVFCGDIFGEPGFRSMNESGYWIENAIRDDQWLEYWVEQESTNPETGETTPVITREMADKLLAISGDRQFIDAKSINLRRQMREAVDIDDPSTAGKPLKSPRKRFMIDERHTIVDGRLCVDFVGEENLHMGRLWYPWDTYGKYTYSEYVPIPDMIEGIGDSTLRISRYLLQLRNARVNQTTDFINNKLLPLLKLQENEALTDEQLIRTAWARVIKLKNLNSLEFQNDPPFPAEAFQDQAQFTREMQQVEPGMNDFQPGSETTPQSGKLATTAILQKQGADAILADELNNQGQFVRDTCELWMWMDQQAMEDNVTIDAEQSPRLAKNIEALSANTEGGNPKIIEIDPMDIQEEFEILPEEGSTLAQDDSYRTQKLQEGFQAAAANPDVFNKRTFAAALLKTIPGISPEEGLAPPPSTPPPPVKIGFNVTAKFEELSADVQTAILGAVGLPTEGTGIMGTVKHTADAVEHIARAGNAAAELNSPAQSGGDQTDPRSAGQRTPTLRTPKGLGKGS